MRKIIYVGQLHDNSGYGVAARTNLKAIKKVKEKYSSSFEVRAFSLSFEKRSQIENDPDFNEIKEMLISEEEVLGFSSGALGEYEVVIHLPIPAAYWAFSGMYEHWNKMKSLFLNSEYNHNISAWESDKVPSNWIGMAKDLNINNFATPSTWNSLIYSRAFGREVHTLPHVIECDLKVSKEKFSFEDQLENNFKIIAISQWQPRKDFETLIRAFYTALHDKSDAVLIIKAYRDLMDSNDSQKKETLEIIKQVEHIKNTVFTESKPFSHPEPHQCKTIFIGGLLQKERLNRLISISDAYSSCTKGEGFGLPISEAMALSKPVIVPNATGHMDFVTDENFLIEGHWDVAHSLPSYPCDSRFYYSHISSAAEQIKKCYVMWKTEKQKLESIGKRNRESLLAGEFTMDSVGNSFFEFLNKGQRITN